MTYLSDPLLRFEPAIDFPVPNARSLAQCIELLQLVKYVPAVPGIRECTNNDQECINLLYLHLSPNFRVRSLLGPFDLQMQWRRVLKMCSEDYQP